MMFKQRIIWFLLSLYCHYVNSNESEETKEDLTEAEAKDGLEIIKTIKKINEDGSYTIGYEADDGSFKIESRDVLGHIKGTYGYVDEDGEIKRVSYTSNNMTEIPLEEPSVVQRIPKTNKPPLPSTRKPSILIYNPTTQSTASSVVQAIPKKSENTSELITTASTTTQKASNYRDYLSNIATTTTNRPNNIVYATPVSLRNIIQPQRPIVRSTIPPRIQKAEGQIARPEHALKNPLLENESPTIKPIVEEREVRGNILRRQLSQEKSPHFDPRQHAATLQQNLGEDSVDVYSASLTTGNPRPLFTTTNRPRILSSPRVLINNPNTQIVASSSTQTSTEYVQEATTEPAVTVSSTPAPVPLYQIPPAQPANDQQSLVAVKHPFHSGVVLVPYNQLRAQENNPQYYVPNGPYFREIRPTPTANSQNIENPSPVFIQRPPVLRSIPVQIDENGYVRPLHQRASRPTPYQVPTPITQSAIPRQASGDGDPDIDGIKPPVSTKDFQKLIELLINRQQRLEQANALINAYRQREFNYQRYGGQPILVRRPHDDPQNAVASYIPEVQMSRVQPYVVPQLQQPYAVRPQSQEARDVYVQQAPVMYTPTSSSYTPTKRVSRLLHNDPVSEHDNHNEQYLPPPVREMLLLRMLQLAINPSLPLEENDVELEEDSTAAEQRIKKNGVRNVEVLGEEEEYQRRISSNKRYRENDYYQ